MHGYVADPLTQLDVFGLSEGSTTLGDRLERAGHTHNIPNFKRSDFRAHHVIPHKVWTANQDFFDDIGLGKRGASRTFPRGSGPDYLQGFNPKDAVENGVFLPKDAPVASRPGYDFDFYHKGGHPDAITDMGASVTDIRDRFRANAITKTQARKEISALQKAERKRLSSRSGTGCIQIP
ncbi:AHH domain-containing protein [Hymenobacter cellulosivorans]|uniref:AHH domain-containing protein n=1 Tax=Hymenobacter cellulosivorans TaxID=2932249 RepID=A0ABY4FHS0_9BACT|nr:AHH domain-containing protein [Hymenobacter cellulosivorans]UOQ55557.1 AHH domain-containing protein [Hymenobacter cellulosivorans]